jgi:hypothetical protein
VGSPLSATSELDKIRAGFTSRGGLPLRWSKSRPHWAIVTRHNSSEIWDYLLCRRGDLNTDGIGVEPPNPDSSAGRPLRPGVRRAGTVLGDGARLPGAGDALLRSPQLHWALDFAPR